MPKAPMTKSAFLLKRIFNLNPGMSQLIPQIYEGDIVEVEDPRGGVDRRIVNEVRIHDPKSARFRNMRYTEIKFGKAPSPRIPPVRRLTIEKFHPRVSEVFQVKPAWLWRGVSYSSTAHEPAGRSDACCASISTAPILSRMPPLNVAATAGCGAIKPGAIPSALPIKAATVKVQFLSTEAFQPDGTLLGSTSHLVSAGRSPGFKGISVLSFTLPVVLRYSG